MVAISMIEALWTCSLAYLPQFFRTTLGKNIHEGVSVIICIVCLTLITTSVEILKYIILQHSPLAFQFTWSSITQSSLCPLNRSFGMREKALLHCFLQLLVQLLPHA